MQGFSLFSDPWQWIVYKKASTGFALFYWLLSVQGPGRKHFVILCSLCFALLQEQAVYNRVCFISEIATVFSSCCHAAALIVGTTGGYLWFAWGFKHSQNTWFATPVPFLSLQAEHWNQLLGCCSLGVLVKLLCMALRERSDSLGLSSASLSLTCFFYRSSLMVRKLLMLEEWQRNFSSCC